MGVGVCPQEKNKLWQPIDHSVLCGLECSFRLLICCMGVVQEESDAVMCIVPQCSAHTTPPSLYCSDACIETYAADSLRDLASRGITFETDPSEFVRGSKGISMVDKATGKTVIGIQAPTDKTLVSWLKQHPSYQVLLPSGKRGRGTINYTNCIRAHTIRNKFIGH